MQRILSVETSRNNALTSEFVTKRLCCSFILTVAFFAVIGGFLLGRFAADRTMQKMKIELSDVSRKMTDLDNNLRTTFHHSADYTNCSVFFNSKLRCDYLTTAASNESSKKSLQETLDILNNCFNNG